MIIRWIFINESPHICLNRFRSWPQQHRVIQHKPSVDLTASSLRDLSRPRLFADEWVCHRLQKCIEALQLWHKSTGKHFWHDHRGPSEQNRREKKSVSTFSVLMWQTSLQPPHGSGIYNKLFKHWDRKASTQFTWNKPGFGFRRLKTTVYINSVNASFYWILSMHIRYVYKMTTLVIWMLHSKQWTMLHQRQKDHSSVKQQDKKHGVLAAKLRILLWRMHDPPYSASDWLTPIFLP